MRGFYQIPLALLSFNFAYCPLNAHQNFHIVMSTKPTVSELSRVHETMKQNYAARLAYFLTLQLKNTQVCFQAWKLGLCLRHKRSPFYGIRYYCMDILAVCS
jgi:hypothetical protein